MVANSVFDMEFDQIPVDLESETLFDQFIYDDVTKLGAPFGDISLMAVGDLLANASSVVDNSFYSGGEFSEENGTPDQLYFKSEQLLADNCEKETTPHGTAKCNKRQGGASSSSGKKVPRHRPTSRNAARERSRVKSLRTAFMDLQNKLPAVPPNTKLSKLDVLVLATTYIAYLMKNLDNKDETTPQEANTSSGLDCALAAGYTPMTSQADELQMADCAGVSEDRNHRLHEKGYLHPVKKWPIRSRLYAGVADENHISGSGDLSFNGHALLEVVTPLPVLDSGFDMLSLP